jgi:hypothetical protein
LQKYLFIILFTIITHIVVGQDTIKPIYKESSLEKWTKDKTCLRFGLGIEKSFSSELGIARHCYNTGHSLWAAKAYYTSLEYIPKLSNNNIYGLKIGYEYSVGYILAIEAKYQTDFKNNHFVITPKLGIGAFGILNLFYGYNISTKENPFSGIGNHQFSIVCNLNKINMQILKFK